MNAGEAVWVHHDTVNGQAVVYPAVVVCELPDEQVRVEDASGKTADMEAGRLIVEKQVRDAGVIWYCGPVSENGVLIHGHKLLERIIRTGKDEGAWTYRYRGAIPPNQFTELVSMLKAPTTAKTG